MPTRIRTVFNTTTCHTIVVYFPSGKSYAIAKGEHVMPWEYLADQTEINDHTMITYDGIVSYAYTVYMIYNDYNICCNNTEGSNKGVHDHPLHVYTHNEDVDLYVRDNEVCIHCDNKNLGIYQHSQPDSYISYYYNVRVCPDHILGGIVYHGGWGDYPPIEDVQEDSDIEDCYGEGYYSSPELEIPSDVIYDVLYTSEEDKDDEL